MRIQILPLPSVMVGDDTKEPFAIIVDQAPRFDEMSPKDHEAWQAFAAACGARALLTVPYTVEIVDQYAEKQPPPVTVNVDSLTAKDPDVEMIREHAIREMERLRSKGGQL